MIRSFGKFPPVIMECDETPEERARALAKSERHMRNVRWFEAHAAEISRTHVGRFVCVAGEELFVGAELAAVLAEARAKHPDDCGAFFYKYISPHRGPKVYANQWILAYR